jgi:hypothetical protein
MLRFVGQTACYNLVRSCKVLRPVVRMQVRLAVQCLGEVLRQLQVLVAMHVCRAAQPI